MHGMTLIELMISLVLGLLVVGAAIGMFVSNRQVFRATDNLSYVQENGRVAFELLARELRQAGGTPCSRNIPIVNVLKNTAAWGTNWGDGVRGYDGTQAFAAAPFGSAAGARVSGTDAIDLRSGESGEVTVVDHHAPSAQFKVNTNAHGLEDGDIVMVCDFIQASIFQITSANPSNVTIVHNPGGSVSPGNCSKGLGWADPPLCTPNGTPYSYGPNSVIARLRATGWYIGVSGSNSNRRSLYQVRMVNSGSGPGSVRQEIAEGVHDMQLEYLMVGDTAYLPAASVTDWSRVSAVRVVLTMRSSENAGTGNAPLERTIAHTVTLRNRNP